MRRRAPDLAGGIIGVGLVVAFGVGLALFAGTYDAAKAADTRFALGADIRITPSVLATHRPDAAAASSFLVPGVRAVSPVVFDVENAVLIGPHNQQRENLAAIDPATIAEVAPLPDEVFVDATGAGTIRALAADPTASWSTRRRPTICRSMSMTTCASSSRSVPVARRRSASASSACSNGSPGCPRERTSSCGRIGSPR